MAPGGRVELLRIEQARTGSGDRRRRIDGNHVVLLGRALQEKPPVIDNDVRQRGTHEGRCLRVEKANQSGNTRNELNSRSRNSPRQHRQVSGAHPEADGQCLLRRLRKESDRQMDHHLGIR